VTTALVEQTRSWFTVHARDLPWRAESRTPWQVVVSEFMLQQTPVARVLPVYEQWVHRWPTPAALAIEPVSEAIKEWGRLGYPRRAMRLHGLARVLDCDFDGEVPQDEAVLRSLPGVGEYTAAAVMSFAFERRALVLDTNIRRVITRTMRGDQWPAVSITNTERQLASDLLPATAKAAAHWNASVMELGALVCTAAQPKCGECPVAALCSWNLAAGHNNHAPIAPRRGTAPIASAAVGCFKCCASRIPRQPKILQPCGPSVRSGKNV